MKIDRAIIIRREGVALSEEYAKTCAVSCETHGLPWEYMDAVQFMPASEAYKSVGTFMNPPWSHQEGNGCCHASHIKCWKRIIEIGKPCLILEHDAYVVGRCTDIDIPDDDIMVITFGHRVKGKDDYKPIAPAAKFVKIARAVGVHACALNVKTATWLWEDARDNGVRVGVDRWLMMGPVSGLPLYVCDPPQVVCWNRQTTMGITSNGPQRHGVRGAFNYKEALTDAWYQGFQSS